jgi:predicted glycosyltransferase
LAPEAIPADVLHCRNGKVRSYPGIKEDVYAWTLSPDRSVMQDLGVKPEEILALVRPPATEAHYHNPESERLFEAAMERLCRRSDVRVILLPRNRRQTEWIQSQWPQWFTNSRVVIPSGALDGLNLIWHADLVISGGGTMNRESAALGVPVYSIFRGPIGAVDKHLQAEGRLTLLSSVEEVENRIEICKRRRPERPDATPRPALRRIVAHVEEILQVERARPIV